MSFLSIPNVKIKGLSACVPKNEVKNNAETVKDFEKLIAATGIHSKRVTLPDCCTSDLCFKAAESLLDELRWDRKEIDVLIFVTQTPDYVLPSTAPILQDKLGLSTSCYCLDLSLGCSGFIYGLSTIASIMQNGFFRKGLLLVGDTISKICSESDKSTFPLFGDAGTATALEFRPEYAGFKFNFGVDGSGKDAIIVKDGGYRNIYNENSLISQNFEEGISRNNTHLVLKGTDVFSFGISKAPKSVQSLIDHFQLEKNNIDYFVFHQANLFMNEKIRKKLDLPEEKVPYSLKEYGNTSSATIPLTMITQLNKLLISGHHQVIACGFGVGLSWGSVYFETDDLVIPEIIEYE